MEKNRKALLSFLLEPVEKSIFNSFNHLPLPFQSNAYNLTHSIIHTIIPHLDKILAPTIVHYMHAKNSSYNEIFSSSTQDTIEKLETYHSSTFIYIYQTIRKFQFHLNGLITRLQKDWEKIVDIFSINSEDKIMDIKITAGDQHGYGAQTSLVIFENNKGFVYKPLGISMDVLFSEMIGWMNENIHLPLKAYHQKILTFTDKDGQYGYIKLLPYNSKATSKQKVEETYYNFGKLIALGKFFSISDGHCDNIIVNVPVVHWIDLECAFHFFEDKINNVHALEKTGLLFEAKKTNAYIGIITGLQGGCMPRLGLTSPSVYNDGTNNMHIRYFKIFEPKDVKNHIYFQNKRTRPEDYIKFIQDGYKEYLTCLYNYKENIISFIKKFNEKNVLHCRYLVQTTASYARFIGLLHHIEGTNTPEILNIIRQERKKTIVESEKRFEHFLIENEITDIVNSVIPYFYRSFNDKHLYHFSKNVAENFFDISLAEQVYQHIRAIDLSTLEQDCEFIYKALSSTKGIENFEDYQKKFDFSVYNFVHPSAEERS